MRDHRILRLAALAAAFALFLALPRTAGTCSCRDALDPRANLESADAVFFGIASEVHREPWLAPWGDGDVKVVFRVFASWKGAERETITVGTSGSSGMCGFPFKEGLSYLVYATGKGDTVWTNRCERTRPGSMAEGDFQSLGKPALDIRRGLSPRQVEEMWQAAAHPPFDTKTGPTWKN